MVRQCAFRGACFTHGFMSLLRGNDDEKKNRDGSHSPGLVVPLVKTLMLPKIFAKMQVRLRLDAFLYIQNIRVPVFFMAHQRYVSFQC